MENTVIENGKNIYSLYMDYLHESIFAEQVIRIFENELNNINDENLYETTIVSQKPSEKRIEQIEKIIRKLFKNRKIYFTNLYQDNMNFCSSQNITILWDVGFSQIILNYFGDQKVIIDQEITIIYQGFILINTEFYHMILDHCPSNYCIYFDFTNNPNKLKIISTDLITKDTNEKLYELIVNYLKENYQDKYYVKIAKFSQVCVLKIEENNTREVAD